ncbi:uncharacterized protein [Antedon mediterranea]|uniref:uncharacterized protein n=1 Tax=Antedon mediterranea TaxID=105859 RepID=UPI003AF64A04
MHLACPADWTPYDGSCYIFVAVRPTNWQTSRSACQNHGGDLVVISSQAENDFVGSLIIALPTNDHWVSAYIGYRDIDEEGEFIWVDTTECITTYTNFRDGEPNNRANEDCVDMHADTHEWNDIWCNGTHTDGYICEIFDDSDSPTFTYCPPDQTVPTDPNENFATLSWVEPTVDEDNQCDISIVSNYDIGDQVALISGLTTTITNTYIATDPSGNTGTCTFSITVTDLEAPNVFNCPGDFTLPTDDGEPDRVTYWTEPTATDNSGSISVSHLHTSGSTFDLGETTVTCRFIDPSGNLALCTFTVTIIDTYAPDIIGCPLSFISPTGVTEPDGVTTWTEPTATDNSGTVPIRSRSHAPGSTFDLGETTVTYTFTDFSGNVASCTFTVTIVGSMCTKQCSNGGTCKVINDVEECQCASNFEGDNCENKDNSFSLSLIELIIGVLFACTVTGVLVGIALKCKRTPAEIRITDSRQTDAHTETRELHEYARSIESAVIVHDNPHTYTTLQLPTTR